MYGKNDVYNEFMVYPLLIMKETFCWVLLSTLIITIAYELTIMYDSFSSEKHYVFVMR